MLKVRIRETGQTIVLDKCLVCGTKLNKANAAAIVEGNLGSELCCNCDYQGGLENEHNDYGHDEPVDDCPLCNPDTVNTVETVKAITEAKTVSTPTGRTNFDHSACTHPRTPAGRAACRKERAKGEVLAIADKAAKVSAQVKRERRKPKAKVVEEETKPLFQLARVNGSEATSHYIEYAPDGVTVRRACNHGTFKNEPEIIWGHQAKCRTCQVRVNPTKLNSYSDPEA